MSATAGSRRPCLAWPFTIIVDHDSIWLVAGEDLRYTLHSPSAAAWLPALLRGCDGSHTQEVLVASVPEGERGLACALIDQLYGERVLIEGTARAAQRLLRARPVLSGQGQLYDALSELARDSEGDGIDEICVLAQDRLDYVAALDFNRECLERSRPWLWATTGPMSRAYVGPLFLPDTGPCLACLLQRFARVPDVYDRLIAHVRAGGDIAPVPFAAPGVAIVSQLVTWKLGLPAVQPAPDGLYQLHVLEAESMALSLHTVFADPACQVCLQYKS